MDEDQSSNDVVYVEDEPNEGPKLEDGPIIKLFRSLITNDSKQNTVLTNAQLVDILQKEFNIDISNVHELEVEIYLNVVKKYLKDWPEWDTFEQAVIDLKSENNSEGVTRILDEKYKNLKKYLFSMLEIAKSMAPSVVKKVTNQAEVAAVDNVDKEDVVIEIQATRIQLNDLIFKHPIGTNKTIFNVNDPILDTHCYSNISLNSILNWWGVTIEMKIKFIQGGTLVLKYDNAHMMQHTLVNKKLQKHCTQKSELHQQWQVKYGRRHMTNISKQDIFKSFDKFLLNGRKKKFETVVMVLHKILTNVTQNMRTIISIPADFRKYLSDYRYVRHLYNDVKDEIAEDADKYDLHIEEVISPMCQLNINVLSREDYGEHVKIYCSLCQLTLTGENMAWEIEDHFISSHHIEPDWQCMNCHKTIATARLTEASWRHICQPTEKVLYNILTS